MHNMEINLSPRFKRAYKKLPHYIQEDFKEKITIFIENPRHLSLKTHKLKGKYQSCFAFKLRDGYRVLFEFSSSRIVNLLDVGPHNIYDKH